MKKNTILILLCLLTSSLAYTQINNNLNYSSFFNINASKEAPAQLGINAQENFQVQLFNPNYYLGSNIFATSDIRNAIDSDFDFVSILNTNDDLYTNAGIELSLLNIAFKTKIANMPFHFSVGYNFMSHTNFLSSNELLTLIKEGNGGNTFRGKTVGIDLDLDHFTGGQFNLGFATELTETQVPSFLKQLRFGANLNFNQSMVGLELNDGNIELTTDEYGRSVDLNYNVDLNSFYDLSEENPNLDLVNGGGLALDFGLFTKINEKFSGSLSLLDLGGLKFDKQTANLTTTNNFLFEGLNISNIFGDGSLFNTDEFDAEIDDLKDDISDFEALNEFKMKMQSRLRIAGIFQPVKETLVHKNAPKYKYYYPHNCFVTYVHGFNDVGLNSTKPLLAMHYIYNLKDVIEVGSNLNFGGANSTELGALLAFKLGPIRLGFEAKNWFSGISNDKIKFDFGMSLNLAPQNWIGIDTNKISYSKFVEQTAYEKANREKIIAEAKAQKVKEQTQIQTQNPETGNITPPKVNPVLPKVTPVKEEKTQKEKEVKIQDNSNLPANAEIEKKEMDINDAKIKAKEAKLKAKEAAKQAKLKAKEAAKQANLKAKEAAKQAKLKAKEAAILKAKEADMKSKAAEMKARAAEMKAKELEMKDKAVEMKAKESNMSSIDAQLNAKAAEMKAKEAAKLKAKEEEFKAKEAQKKVNAPKYKSINEQLDARAAEIRAKEAAKTKANEVELKTKETESQIQSKGPAVNTNKAAEIEAKRIADLKAKKAAAALAKEKSKKEKLEKKKKAKEEKLRLKEEKKKAKEAALEKAKIIPVQENSTIPNNQ